MIDVEATGSMPTNSLSPSVSLCCYCIKEGREKDITKIANKKIETDYRLGRERLSLSKPSQERFYFVISPICFVKYCQAVGLLLKFKRQYIKKLKDNIYLCLTLL